MALHFVGKYLIRPRTQRNIRRYSTELPHILHTPPTKLTTLPSGLKVATGESFGEVANVGLWLDVGSANENDLNNGITNFFQKLSLLGTANKTRSQLAQEIEGIGASLAGSTDRERTSFVAQSHKQDVPKIVEILGEIIKNNSWKQDDIEKTRSIVIKKIKEDQKKTNMDILLDHIHSAAFQGSSYASTPAGEENIVSKINSSELQNFHKTFITAPNIVLVGTGAINHEQLVELANKTFSSLPTHHSPSPPSFVDFIGSEIRIRDDTLHLARAVFAFETVSTVHPLYWANHVLRVLVGSWSRDAPRGLFTSSRLAETVALEKLGHSFESFFLSYRQCGVFGVYVETTEGKLEDMTYEVFNEFQKLATYISPQEFERAKNQLKLEVLNNLQRPSKLAANLAESALVSYRSISIAEQIKRIDDISTEDIAKLLDTYLTDVDPVVVGLGNLEDLPDYNIMRSWTYWNRW